MNVQNIKLHLQPALTLFASKGASAMVPWDILIVPSYTSTFILTVPTLTDEKLDSCVWGWNNQLFFKSNGD